MNDSVDFNLTARPINGQNLFPGVYAWPGTSRSRSLYLQLSEIDNSQIFLLVLRVNEKVRWFLCLFFISFTICMSVCFMKALLYFILHDCGASAVFSQLNVGGLGSSVIMH